ncbi:MAG: hypothetical protein Q9219_004787 [cf. Caloplaca sp. 3 TL-2023]
MDADNDPRVDQWLSQVQDSPATDSPNDTSPSQLRRRKDTSPEPNHFASSSQLTSKRLHLDPQSSSNAIHQRQPALVDSAGFLFDSRNDVRHIEGLEFIEMPPKQPSTPNAGPSKSSQASKNIPLTVKPVRDHLAAHGMWFEHPRHRTYQDLQNLVNGILFATPGMDMTAESAEKIKTYLHEHATTNEKTLLERSINLLITTTRTIPKKHDIDGKVKEVIDTLLNQIAVDQDFIQDGLESIRDKEYVRGFLPLQTVENKTLGLTDPKPDMTWGLKIPQFPIPGRGMVLLEQDVEAMVKICPEIQHAFFAIEYGSCEKSLEQVENQSIRTGANLVEARRRLNARATAAKQARERQPTPPKNPPAEQSSQDSIVPATAPMPSGADLDSIAFTVSWVPQMAKLHVHWYEENVAPVGIWHMSMLNVYVFCRESSLQDFRRDIGNILAWGTYKRRQEVEKVMKDIYSNY